MHADARGYRRMDRKRFNAILDADVIRRLKIQALREGVDVSAILERLIRDYLDRVEGHASD